MTDSVHAASRADREYAKDSAKSPDQEETADKPGSLPPYSQLYFLNSFPDVRLSSLPDVLVQIPRELPARGRGPSLRRATRGLPAPFAIWLYGHLNIVASASYSRKRDGPLCCMNAGPGQGGSLSFQTSAEDVGCGLMTKGWHLHASLGTLPHFVFVFVFFCTYTASGSSYTASGSSRFRSTPLFGLVTWLLVSQRNP